MTIEPHPADGGWISGSMRDTRPQYSPAVLIIEVQRVLRAHGIVVEADRGMMLTASIAAADLLNALGVKPASAPQRPQ